MENTINNTTENVINTESTELVETNAVNTNAIAKPGVGYTIVTGLLLGATSAAGGLIVYGAGQGLIKLCGRIKRKLVEAKEKRMEKKEKENQTTSE